MYNSRKPSAEDLPSSTQLIKSTIIAFLVAVVVLLVAVLPAEYGVDITGLGKVFGLQQMGEIKAELEQANHKQEKQELATVETNKPIEEKPAEAQENSASIEFQLEPGQSIEYKLEMDKDAEVHFLWEVSGGAAFHDTHGDAGKDFISYKKGRDVQKDEGLLKAAFTGNHGWYWKNKGDKAITIKLDVKGNFKYLRRYI